MIARTSRLRKDYDCIHIRQSGENFGAFFGGHQWPSLALESAHGVVAVYGNHEFATQFARRVQVAHMADVQKIEAAVGKGDAVATFAPARDSCLQLLARDDLGMGKFSQSGETRF